MKVWRPGEEYVMGCAFVDLVRFLVKQPGVVEAFERDTGNRFLTPTSPIERLIDEATGQDVEYIRHFMRWVQKNHWGEELPPDLEQMLTGI